MGRTPDTDGREVFAVVLEEPLDGGDFVLRRARETDLPLIADLSDDELRARLLLPADADAAFLAPFLLHGGSLLIADSETDLPLGGMRMFLHGDAIEFGYWLTAPARGRGLATRSLAVLSAHLVDRLRPSRFELRTGVGNEPSERVALRAEYTRIGPEPPIEYPGGRVLQTTLWVREPGG